MARHLGWHQTRVSKLEQGSQRPTDDDLRQWGEAAGATTEQLDELFALASAARVEYATFAQRYHQHGGAVAEQESTAQADSASTRIAEFQPAMIPGLLQTAATLTRYSPAPAAQHPPESPTRRSTRSSANAWTASRSSTTAGNNRSNSSWAKPPYTPTSAIPARSPANSTGCSR